MHERRSAVPSKRRSWSYLVHGLGIRSELRLPELRPGRVAPDVHVRLANVDAPDAVRQDGLSWLVAPDGAFFCGDRARGVVEVRSGHEIRVEPAGRAGNARSLRLLVLGVALRALLHQRELLVLHASVAAVDGKGVAFMGDHGVGKSTIAAACLDDGLRVVTDDIAAIDLSGPDPLVHPGAPQLKLHPSAAAMMRSRPDALVPLASRNDKLAWRKPSAWRSAPVPLARVYELVPSSTSELRRLEGHDALIALLRNSNGGGLGLVHDRHSAALHFEQCAHVARRIPIGALSVRRDLASLGDAIGVVKDDSAGLAPEARGQRVTSGAVSVLGVPDPAR
jgi:hypothetical protein